MSNEIKQRWNERFSIDEFAYGKEPNIFLKEFYESNSNLFLNPVLMLGDGEGRNGVYLASQGLAVYSLDFAEMGIIKTLKLAEEKNVRIRTILADVNKFNFVESYWGTIVLIYLHLESKSRKNLWSKIQNSLKPNGIFFLEAFSIEQLNYESGGPKDPNLLFTKSELEENFLYTEGKYKFEILLSEQKVVTLHEGKFHEGPGSVVRFICKKIEG